MEGIRLRAIISFKSNLDILKVGDLLSDNLFGGLKFIGLEKHIHEEVPAIYIDQMVMGLQFILNGDEKDGYYLEVGYHPLASKYIQDKDEITFAFFNRGFEQYIRNLMRYLPDLIVI